MHDHRMEAESLESIASELGEDAVAHSARFRKVSNRYPRRVAEAYAGDLGAAMAASDEEVASKVEAWEREQGPERDWPRIGREHEGRGRP